MIEQVNNLTIKSFNNYTGPLEKFKSKNIIKIIYRRGV
jgi:hypothetical protein